VSCAQGRLVNGPKGSRKVRPQEPCKDVWGAENCGQVPQIFDGGHSFREHVCSRPHYMLSLGPEEGELAAVFWLWHQKIVVAPENC
jgi:hypothetical protein